MNLASSTFPACSSTGDPVSATHHPVSGLSRLTRMVSIFGKTTWTVGRVHVAADPSHLLHRWALSTLRTLRVRVDVHGQLHSWPQLWVSNHLSWLDPLVLMSLRPMGALAKSEVANYPLIGAASRKAGLAFVDRSDPTSRASALTRLASDLRQGKPMLLFPEGTTTRGERLAPLQAGGLRAAYRCGTPIQTMRLFSEDSIYPWIGDDSLVPHILSLLRSARTRISVQAGPVFEPWQFPCEEGWIETIRRELAP